MAQPPVNIDLMHNACTPVIIDADGKFLGKYLSDSFLGRVIVISSEQLNQPYVPKPALAKPPVPFLRIRS
jgi:hypothetical protein